MPSSVKIVTIYDPFPNYGNRLQNFAVQSVLERMGLRVVTISFQQKIQEEKNWWIKLIIHRITGYKLSKSKNYWKYLPPRLLVFDKFNRKYIHTQRVKQIEDIGEADYFVIGSDQVWNAAWYADCDMKKDMFLLTFAKPEQKVCFSPSFGIDRLPEEWIPWFKQYLPTFPDLSVREESGARLIKDLTGRDAVVTIDPTLMLDKEDWMKIAKKPRGVDCSGKYILTYFLGGRSEAVEEDIKEYAAKAGAAAVYNLIDYTQPDLLAAGPSEFVYLIANAQLVLTDSFHACVFSFLFGKPFLCYDRPGKKYRMNSRMETLFARFNLQRKYVKSGLPNELLECDYTSGYAALKTERERLIDYLKKAMHME